MGYKLIRRFFIIRLALSFILDYFRISIIKKLLQGNRQEEAVSRICARAGRRMRLTAFRLEGIIVKIGQFLSMRQDILPKAFTEELTDLQDSVPAEPFSVVKPFMEQELKRKLEKVFPSFEEEAFAAASLAQVHRATLPDGTKVAVKVIRPQMEQVARADLDSLGFVAKVTQRIPALSRKLNFVEMHREFTETIERELDCCQELLNLHRFEEMFSEESRVAVPRPLDDLTTRHILVMEYVQGARITNAVQLDRWGVEGAEVAEILLDLYFRQLFVYGFVHVDPHPGNLLILPDHRICLLDFGMVDELSAAEVHTLRSLMQSIMMGHVDGILDAFESLGFIRQGADREPFKPVIRTMLERLGGGEEIQVQPESALRGVLQSGSFQLQAKYMFLLRAAGFLKTALAQLAPDTDWLELLMKTAPQVFSTPVKIRR